ncbi:MAG: ubiquitin-conjugating enzyme E2 [Amphiamblys sp. WSBS2006]|nr:MAG: ubiquitin-conjugating enzyme E2 [Amphiamblys sp. WSBS2006]
MTRILAALLFAALSVSCIPRALVIRRLKFEMREIENDPLPLISIEQPDKDNLFKWVATMQGPEGTPFEGGSSKVDITIPDNYPFSPPAVRFISEMFHPNIFGDGSICLDILEKAHWNKEMTMKGVLLSIQSLLNDPNPSSPVNEEATIMFYENMDEYKKRVRATFE